MSANTEIKPWRVAEFWSSANPGTTCLMLAKESQELRDWERRSDFIRWHSPDPAAQNFVGELPPLPKPDSVIWLEHAKMEVPAFFENTMRNYVSATLAQRAGSNEAIANLTVGEGGLHYLGVNGNYWKNKPPVGSYGLFLEPLPPADAKPAGWIQFIDGEQTQNFCRDESELKTCKDIAKIYADGKRVEYVQVYTVLPAAVQPDSGEQHYDDYAVDEFAKMMKSKLAASRAKGRGGWEDPEQCSTQDLNRMLLYHVAKGDPIDVANFCMMLRHYNARIALPDSGRDAALIQRYDMTVEKSQVTLGYRACEYPAAEGDWVKFADVAAALAAQPSEQAAGGEKGGA